MIVVCEGCLGLAGPAYEPGGACLCDYCGRPGRHFWLALGIGVVLVDIEGWLEEWPTFSFLNKEGELVHWTNPGWYVREGREWHYAGWRKSSPPEAETFRWLDAPPQNWRT